MIKNKLFSLFTSRALLKALSTTVIVIMLSVNTPTPVHAAWAEDAIQKECNYIVNCSWTEYTTNKANVSSTDSAYGSINVNRISTSSTPDWVRPGESAMGVIGLMRGAIELKARSYDITSYDQVIRKFFWDWSNSKALGTAENNTSSSADYGAWTSRVYYSSDGNTYSKNDGWDTGATAQMLIAAWKYYEYCIDTGDSSTASSWLSSNWAVAQAAADYLCKMYNSTYKLEKGSSTAQDMWITNTSYAAAALKCADRWATVAGKTKNYNYAAFATNLGTGLNNVKDTGSWKNFFRYVSNSDGSKNYGDCIDQICFAPYEANAVSVSDSYAGQLSDWWTDPGTSASFKMTYQTNNSSDWRYYGTHWHYYFNGSTDNNYLYPGPGLELAKVEWKYGNATNNSTYKTRAANRFQFANSTAYSNLWCGVTGQTESGVGNGIIDWRSQDTYGTEAPTYNRYVDTSAYFIEVCAMVMYNVDTCYTPVK